MTVPTVQELSRLAPFGSGNPVPVFLLQNAAVDGIWPLGSEGRHCRIRLRQGGAAAAAARDTLIRHNLRLVAHICKKYYAGDAAQDDYISIGTIGLIKAVDTFDPDKGKKFASYASRCIENELRMELRRTRRAGPQLSLQEPLEAGGQLTLADTLPDETDMEADCEQRADAARLRSMVEQLPGRERQIMRLRYGFGGAAQTQQQTAQTLHISRSYVSRLEKRALKLLRDRWKESS